MRTCSVEGCENKHKAHGLCNGHAGRQYRGVPLDDRPISRVQHEGCLIDGCEREHVAGGFCFGHYQDFHYNNEDGRRQRAEWLGEGKGRYGAPLDIKYYWQKHLDLMAEFDIEPIADMIKPKPRAWVWDQLTELTGVVHEKPTTRTEQTQQWRKLKRMLPVPDHVHGITGYTSYGCRCEVCTKAQREAARARSRKKV